MKLLFDQNLSPRLVERLSDLYPKSAHVSECNLDEAQDDKIWQYAFKREYLIVSKESDFNEMSVIRGFPPKVISIRRGNCSTRGAEHILRINFERVQELHQDDDKGILLLS